MGFNATFINISVISWRSVLLMEETGVPRERHRPAASNGKTLSHNVVSSTPCLSSIRTPNEIHKRIGHHYNSKHNPELNPYKYTFVSPNTKTKYEGSTRHPDIT